MWKCECGRIGVRGWACEDEYMCEGKHEGVSIGGLLRKYMCVCVWVGGSVYEDVSRLYILGVEG